eukprot:6591535-Ditylum_brightwellii.AAC.1
MVIFAVREYKNNNTKSTEYFLELLELEWNDGDDDNMILLNSVNSRDIDDSKGAVEGITWVPDDKDGILFIAIDNDSNGKKTEESGDTKDSGNSNHG